jgi:GH24 family phage-related lysozyme (muramidase)
LKPRLSPEHDAAVRDVLGKKGAEAKAALETTPDLLGLRVSRLEAAEIFPYVARPYWQALLKRFPNLGDPETPAEVHTAMLSLAYNRGAGNKGLEPLRGLIAAGDWKSTGDLIASMQQDHELEGIRKRRRAEGALILSSLA